VRASSTRPIPSSFSRPSRDDIPINLPTARNGKIAKLPRPIRDQINRCFDSGQSAVSIADHLNKLPEVKAMLEAHFEGRPIKPQNLCEWKAGGYRDWQMRQELLLKQSELAADAQEMGQIANGMADSLYGMLMLEYAQLMKDRDKYTPEEFEKKRKDLSAWAQDVVRLRRCENQTRSVEVQEERLERDREKTAEEIFLKFMEWAGNPEIRRTFILEPMVCMALQRRHFGLPPRPEDAAVLKEYDLAKAAEKQADQTETAPPRTENPEAESCRSRREEALTREEMPPSSEDEANSKLTTQNSTLSGSLTPPTSHSPIRPICPISPIAQSSGSPAGCGTLARDNIPGERAPVTSRPEGAPENPPIDNHGDQTEKPNAASLIGTSSPSRDNSSPALSPYEQALREGKSHLEAMYAQFTPTPEERERRKRHHEELVKAAAAAREPRPPQPGFSPPPIVPFPVRSVFG
jgi:hypothetical protein